jgi:hypothetical protein
VWQLLSCRRQMGPSRARYAVACPCWRILLFRDVEDVGVDSCCVSDTKACVFLEAFDMVLGTLDRGLFPFIYIHDESTGSRGVSRR